MKPEPTVTFIFEEHTIKTTAIEMTEKEIEEFFEEIPFQWKSKPRDYTFLNGDGREYIGRHIDNFKAGKFKATRIMETEEKLPLIKKDLGNYPVYRLQLIEKYGSGYNK